MFLLFSAVCYSKCFIFCLVPIIFNKNLRTYINLKDKKTYVQ